MQSSYKKVIGIAFVIGLLLPLYILWPDKSSIMAPAYSHPVSNSESGEAMFPHPDKTDYMMKLYLDNSNRTISGESLITTINTSGRDLQDFSLTAYPNAFRRAQDSPAPPEAYFAGFNPGWIDISSATVNGEKAVINNKEDISINIKSRRPIKQGEKIDIVMIWTVKIPRMAYRFGTKEGVFMLENFYPQLNVLTDKGWLQSDNVPFGDPFCFHCANYIVEINIPDAYKPVGMTLLSQPIIEDNGRQKYLLSAKNLRDFSITLMYDCAVNETKVGAVTVKTLAPYSKLNEARSFAEAAKNMLSYYNNAFGQYPYSEFNIVFVPMKGFHGMEHSGLIFLDDQMLNYDYDKEYANFILAHEIAHQWWYGIVGSDQIKEPWLDEGLANWSAYKYLAEYAKGALPAIINKPSRTFPRELREFTNRNEYQQSAYLEGSQFWFALEKELGNEKVLKILRKYSHDYKFRIATTNNLMEIIKAEEKNADSFLAKWITQNSN